MLDPQSLRAAVRHEGGISRRLFLAYSAALAGIPMLAGCTQGARARTAFSADPFSLGVASGDPDQDGMVLWTRLAPQPLQVGGGMAPEPVEVRWEVAEDEGMRKIVRSGTATAAPQLGHSVHVELGGLQPDRWYFYRFMTGDATSPIGRTRTLPTTDATPERLRFAFASCQHFEAGHFTAYEQMAKDELDLIVHLGDYIYEGAARNGAVRRHLGPKLRTLDDYRLRHCQYRAEPLLHRAHARCPWLVTWDDHELENNCAGAISERKGVSPEQFLIMRAAAYQAYYEMMPLRSRSIPRGPDLQLYRNASFGRLAEFLVLDSRQYRSDQPNIDKRAPLNAAAMADSQTMMGATQRDWVKSSLTKSPAQWNILAQQVMMALVDLIPGDEEGFSMDQWPGYAHERIELVKFMAERQVSNPVVLTGDIHSNWVNDLRVNDRHPETPVIATEFVGTSITSNGNGTADTKGSEKLYAENACVRFHNRQRGYVRCTVTPKEWRSDYMVTPEVEKPGGTTSLLKSFVVESGTPGAKPA